MTWTASGDAFEHGANAVVRLPAIDADADGFGFAMVRNFSTAPEAFVVEPAVLPSVKLDEVEFFDAEISELLLTYSSM